ncbi:FAD binding domain-containing protein [Halostagnicola bangensis]
MAIEAYYRPETLEEALDLSAEYRSSLDIISGGTIAMPAINEGKTFPDRVMDIRDLDLDFVESSNGERTLGATLTLTGVLEKIDEPFLRDAARHTGGWSIRNMGTVGGNLFSPPPLGDFAVALLALDAEIEVQQRDEQRWISLSEFYAGPKSTAIEADELVTAVRLPPIDGDTTYTKYTRSQEPAQAIVTVAVNLERQDGVVETARIALNGAGPHPVRMHEAEDILEGKRLERDAIERAAEAAAEEADPPEDAIASAWYRRKMIRHHLSNALCELRNQEETK